MRIIKIRMNSGYETSNHCIDIKDLYVINCDVPGWYPKAGVYDAINNGASIRVNRYPYPECVCAKSQYGEKYVRSEPNDTENDNLLKLPRE